MKIPSKKVIVIGSGFSSLSAACYLAKSGFEVVILEKNEQVGGRARQLVRDGFTFDMGPTFYWMPEVMEGFFHSFGKSTSDYFELVRLNPGYEVYFGELDSIKINDTLAEIYEVFEKEERGSSLFLKKFLASAKFNYDVAMDKVVHRPGLSPFELIMPETILRVNQFFSSISSLVRRNIKSHKLLQILEFPVLFLGAKPSKTPAFYNFMNYADLVLGTWYAIGGMHKLVEAVEHVAIELGVKIHTNSPAESIIVEHGKAIGVVANGKRFIADYIVSGADYHHTETLLEKDNRAYSESYWQKKTFAPSGLLFYVGFDKKLANVSHHTLFFDSDFAKHAEDIYDSPAWPEDPLFYSSFPSITDSTVAPLGKEAGIFLIPLAPGLEDTPELREQYFKQILTRMEHLTNQSLFDSLLFKESFCVNDFVKDYNSYKGNAYGLANILTQTAFLRPKIKSKKVENLFFTGQLTVPGPGVPPAFISGKIAADLLIKKSLQDGRTI
jgi:phytoene desaturase